MSQALHEYALKNSYGASPWHEPLFSVFFGDLTEAQTAALKLELQETAKRLAKREPTLDKPELLNRSAATC